MIQILYTIGKVLSKNEDYQKYFEPWEDPFPNKDKSDETKVLVIRLKNKAVESVDIENFSAKKTDKYLFRSIRGANGTNLVPTFYFQLSRKVDKEKWEKDQSENIRKLVKKITASIKNYNHNFISKEGLEKLPELLLEKSKDLNSNESYIITMTIDGQYLGDFNDYKNLFEEEAYSKYYDVSKAKDKICSVTYQREKEVWGRVSTLGFTVNDNAFSRNGFSGKDSYKMLPVSEEAVKLLEGSRNIIFNQLSRRFYNLNYIIVPHFIKRENEETIEEILESFIKNSKSESYEITGDSIILNEMILKAIAEESKLQGSVYYDILFYQQQQAQFLIKLQLSDVIPSQIKRIFEVKKKIEKRYDKITKIEYEDKKTKKKVTNHFHINFGIIKDYFSKKVKTDYVYQPYFFKVLEAVFYKNHLNEQQIIKAFLKQIQQDFKQRNEDGKSTSYIRRTKSSFALYQYFLNLGLFKNKTPMEENQEQTVHLTAEEFINQHLEFFDNQYKIGVFLLGNLSAYLMSKQYNKLKSNPFMKQLNSLNIDEKTVKGILPKLINKLREYDLAIPDMEQKIAKSLVTEHSLTKADISYTFTLGLIMQKEFAKAYKKKKAEESKSEQEN